MRVVAVRAALVAAALAHALGVPSGVAAEETLPLVVAVELVSQTRLPERLVRVAIGELAGQALSRRAVRESLERLWVLGLFREARVELVPASGGAGVVLRYHLVRRPLIGAIRWGGTLGLDLARLVQAARLARGEALTAERLARAREDLEHLYGREGYLDAKVRLDTVPDPATEEHLVSVVVEAGEPARFAVVRLVGDLGLPPDRVAGQLGIGRGDRYRERTADDRVRSLEAWLRAEGFFEARVAARTPVPGPEGVTFEVDVQAGPRYRVELVGVESLKDAEVRARLTFAEAGTVDAAERRSSARQVEARYRQEGFHFVAVDIVLDGEAAARTLHVRVEEGPRVRVGTVALSGELTSSKRAERLRARLETRPPGFLEPGRFRQDVLDRDLAGILTALHAEGFADAKVGPAELVFGAERRRVDVTIPIVEGPRLVAGEVSVEGHTVVDTADLLGAVPLRPGEPFSAARAEQGRRAIEQLYAQRGYHAARVEVDTARGDGTVTARYRVREGEGTRIGRVLLRGLVLTQEETVLGQVDLEPGAPFDPGRLVEAQRRLSRAPALVATQVGPLRPEPRPFADAEITVSEPKPWRLEAEAGYDSAEGARGRLTVGHDNLFGTARRLSVGHKEAIGGQSISRLQRTEMTYEEPWLGRTSWQGALNLFAERTENIGYDLDRFGLSVLVGEDLAGAAPARGLRSRLGYRLEQVERSNVSDDLKATGIQAAENRVASLTPSLAWDLRDDRFEPSRGSAHTLSLEVASLVFGSEVGFAKGEVGTSWFASLKPLVFALSGRLGLAAPLIDDDEIPIEDRFFTGGATSVRGYREDRVGPLDADRKPLGGNALVVLNAEVRFPVWGWLRGALFVDSGAVTPEVSDLSLDAFRTGVGLGLRLSTPVGPIRLDVGYALDPIPGEDRLQFYLTVGHAF